MDICNTLQYHNPDEIEYIILPNFSNIHLRKMIQITKHSNTKTIAKSTMFNKTGMY